MHKTTQLSLLVAISSALALTACGGGGSSAGSTTVQPTPVVKPNTPNQAGTNPSTPNTTKPNTTNPTGNNAGTKPTTPNTNTPPTTPSITNPSSPVTPPNNTDTNPNTNTPTPTTPPTTGNHSEKPNTPPTNTGADNIRKEITGEVAIIDDKVTNVHSDNVNKLTVNGKTFDLSSFNTSTNFSKNMSLDDEVEVQASTHLKHAKYGFIIDWKNAIDYLFYQGEKTPTANMPTAGIANYTGQSLYICGDCDDEVVQGTSKFTADFGKKTLTGSISNEQAKVALSATISGNTFSGTNGAGTETRGAFFGDKAQEISGIFNNDDKDFAGAFGATKQ